MRPEGRTRAPSAAGRARAVEEELRLLSAYHEAGHAVVAALRGAELARVTTTSRGPRSGECALRLRAPVRGSSGAEGARLRLARAAIAVALGGSIAAERLARQRGYELRPPVGGVRPLFGAGAGEDERIALAAASTIPGGEASRRGLLRRTRGETERLLAAPRAWRAVRALAAALLRAGTLDARDAGRVVARALRPPDRKVALPGLRRAGEGN